jgi:RNA polymerase sigma-70 factor (ECF subfamily)
MSEEPSFRDLIRRVRARDAEAMAELTRRYLPAIKRVVRARLSDPALRRLYDSVDFCQSVLVSLFVRMAAGQYDIEEEGQLFKLLEAMARNKVAKEATKRRAQKHGGCVQTESLGEQDVAASGPDPSDQAAYEELLAKLQASLSDQERQLADLRARRWSWKRIAVEVDGQPDALRMQLTRAIDRCTRELGLE